MHIAQEGAQQEDVKQTTAAHLPEGNVEAPTGEREKETEVTLADPAVEALTVADLEGADNPRGVKRNRDDQGVNRDDQDDGDENSRVGVGRGKGSGRGVGIGREGGGRRGRGRDDSGGDDDDDEDDGPGELDDEEDEGNVEGDAAVGSVGGAEGAAEGASAEGRRWVRPPPESILLWTEVCMGLGGEVLSGSVQVMVRLPPSMCGKQVWRP